MDKIKLKELLEEIAGGNCSPADGFAQLSSMPFDDIGCAKHDTHRFLRNGFSEVIYCEGKSPEDVVRITNSLIEKKNNVFGTRLKPEHVEALLANTSKIDICERSRTFQILNRDREQVKGKLTIACGGTADIPVAEEAWRTANFFGLEATRVYDVGIAGIHRTFAHLNVLRSADAVIAVAGMEGALPSVVGGLIDSPIIAVPTSIGYGANLGGLTALFAMLNSCSEGISVTNIDNGFGAACAAMRIIRRLA
jgi:NCAIR mutase (PurE)-related protein